MTIISTLVELLNLKTAYGKLKNVKLELITFSFIDPQYISNAETDIKNLFVEMDFKLDHDKFVELAVVPNDKIKFIKKQYATISKAYMGHISELISKIKEKDHEIALKENQLLLKEKENELLRKELEIMNLKNKIKKIIFLILFANLKNNTIYLNCFVFFCVFCVFCVSFYRMDHSIFISFC